MNDPRLMQLIALKLSGDATPEDLDALGEYLRRDPEAAYALEIMTSIWNRATNMGEESAIQDIYAAHREKYATDFPSVFLSPTGQRQGPATDEGPTMKEGPTAQGDATTRENAIAQDNSTTQGLSTTQEGATAQERAGRAAKRRPLFSKIWYAAACVAGVLGISAGIYYFSGRQAASPRLPELAEIAVKKGGRTRVMLPDSTQVWLNGGSRLIYDKEMNSQGERLVTLNGEGYFIVGPDKARPFIVNTDKIRIRVLGTSFTVRDYNQDSTAETTLMQGKIEVSMKAAPDQRQVLRPLEKFIVRSGKMPRDTAAVSGPRRHSIAPVPVYHITQTQPVQITGKMYQQDTCWLHNQLVFHNTTFREIIPKLEERYQVKINLKNTQLANCRYTAILGHETLEEVLKAMKLIRPFTYTVIQDKDSSLSQKRTIIIN